ncbi:hypothetical protein ACKGJN_11255 [Gillisia sp. Q332]|uniref:hypothetical protein n=1 Tax=Gillisia xinjiangensis TaxID=3384765 RepID=UPI00391B9EFB
MDYWIQNSHSFLHQIFMLVMAGLYASAWLFGVSYKAINIYFYFVLFPLSFTLLLRGWKKFIFIPVSFLFFIIPDFEVLSVKFFDLCVDFLNRSAETFDTNYIAMSVYLCVLVPVVLYVPLLWYKAGKKRALYVLGGLAALCGIYLITIYPNFKSILEFAQQKYF